MTRSPSGGERRTVSIHLDVEGPLRPVNLLEKRGYDVDGKTVELELEPYGVRWFRVGDVQASEKGATPRSDG